MPLQNRVTPFGDIIATSERGTMMGNRGVLHNEQRELIRSTQVRRWIVCRLAFHGRHRIVMKPGSYTELFFLDEVTALAAGHRPCFECRRAAFYDFQSYWQHAFGTRPRADDVDRQLAHDRLLSGAKNTYQANLADLPEGSMIYHDNAAWLVQKDYQLRWSPSGYTASLRLSPDTSVCVLTPNATVAVLKAGYAPSLHPSAYPSFAHIRAEETHV